MVSSRFVQKLNDVFPNGVVLKNSLAVKLQLGTRRAFKLKPADALATEFFNVVAEARLADGSSFQVGCASEDGLVTPGES